MKSALAALLLALAAPARGAVVGSVRRGDLIVRVKVTGTVVPDDVFRLKSTIDGRIETINTSTYSWHGSDEALATVVVRELAAMIDSRGTQNQDVLEDRWQHVYRPTPVRCPGSYCYILKVYAKAHTWVKPQAVLFEASRDLRLVARVRPEDAHWIRDGQLLTFWAVKNPKRRYTGRVTNYILDIQGEKVDPGATFSIDLGPERPLDPGTEWEGEIIPLQKSDVLTVPTAALIEHDGVVYLPVRVSTGLTTPELTQISAGTEDKREILILDEAQLHGAERHKQTVDRDALEQRLREREGASGTDGTGSFKAPAAKTQEERQPATVEEKNYGGEDPYGEQ